MVGLQNEAAVSAQHEEGTSRQSDDDDEGDEEDNFVVDDATVAFLLGNADIDADTCDGTIDGEDHDSDAAPDFSSECDANLLDDTLQAGEAWGAKSGACDVTDSGFISDSSEEEKIEDVN